LGNLSYPSEQRGAFSLDDFGNGAGCQGEAVYLLRCLCWRFTLPPSKIKLSEDIGVLQKGTTAIAISFMGLGIFVFYIASSFPIPAGVSMGPGYFPKVLAILMTLNGAAILIKGRLRADQEQVGVRHPFLVAISAITFIAYLLTLPLIGYLPSTLMFLIIYMSILARSRSSRWASLGLGLAITLGLYSLFHFLLGQPLP